mmetsp:Transcript_1631/g.4518  ORF Transcript_1631/g.4518 Transcript_1631/m.4518 type:complete len:80 (-) Transcript_1631:266-505(-)
MIAEAIAHSKSDIFEFIFENSCMFLLLWILSPLVFLVDFFIRCDLCCYDQYQEREQLLLDESAGLPSDQPSVQIVMASG